MIFGVCTVLHYIAQDGAILKLWPGSHKYTVSESIETTARVNHLYYHAKGF